MASRRSFRSLPWLLLLEFLADVVAAVAVPKPLMLGIAEPPGAAARPAGASRPGGGGRPDRSVAGADVILVGFTAAVVVVVSCISQVVRGRCHMRDAAPPGSAGKPACTAPAMRTRGAGYAGWWRGLTQRARGRARPACIPTFGALSS